MFKVEEKIVRFAWQFYCLRSNVQMQRTNIFMHETKEDENNRKKKIVCYIIVNILKVGQHFLRDSHGGIFRCIVTFSFHWKKCCSFQSEMNFMFYA